MTDKEVTEFVRFETVKVFFFALVMSLIVFLGSRLSLAEVDRTVDQRLDRIERHLGIQAEQTEQATEK